MRAMETIYRGRHLGSPLEVRFAVFFDALEIAWEYEPKEFALDGLWYLPDFYLPDLDLWIDIKEDSYDPEAAIMPWLLAVQSGRPVYLMDGNNLSGLSGIYFQAT